METSKAKRQIERCVCVSAKHRSREPKQTKEITKSINVENYEIVILNMI